MSSRQRSPRSRSRHLVVSGFGVAVGCVGGTALAVSPSSYDSGGFDTVSRFSTSFTNANDTGVTGTLRGQDAAVDQWFFSTSNSGLATSATGTARVITAGGGSITGGAVFSGTQAIRVDRISADNRWTPVLSMTAAPATNVVKVT